jgi:hypothetical protein
MVVGEGTVVVYVVVTNDVNVVVVMDGVPSTVIVALEVTVVVKDVV